MRGAQRPIPPEKLNWQNRTRSAFGGGGTRRSARRPRLRTLNPSSRADLIYPEARALGDTYARCPRVSVRIADTQSGRAPSITSSWLSARPLVRLPLAFRGDLAVLGAFYESRGRTAVQPPRSTRLARSLATPPPRTPSLAGSHRLLHDRLAPARSRGRRPHRAEDLVTRSDERRAVRPSFTPPRLLGLELRKHRTRAAAAAFASCASRVAISARRRHPDRTAISASSMSREKYRSARITFHAPPAAGLMRGRATTRRPLPRELRAGPQTIPRWRSLSSRASEDLRDKLASSVPARRARRGPLATRSPPDHVRRSCRSAASHIFARSRALANDLQDPRSQSLSCSLPTRKRVRSSRLVAALTQISLRCFAWRSARVWVARRRPERPKPFPARDSLEVVAGRRKRRVPAKRARRVAETFGPDPGAESRRSACRPAPHTATPRSSIAA